MHTATPTPIQTHHSQWRRLPWQRWWQRQSPARQDRVANFAPIAAVVLFMAAIATAFLHLQGEELAHEREAVQRDVEYAQQRLRLRLLERQEQVSRLVRDMAEPGVTRAQLLGQAQSLVRQYPEYHALTWVNERQQVVATHSVAAPEHTWVVGQSLATGPTLRHHNQARTLRQPVYGIAPPQREGALAMLQLHSPTTDAQGRSTGVLMAEYALEDLLRYGVPTELLAKYAISLVGAKGLTLAGQTIPESADIDTAHMWTSPVGNDYRLAVSPVGEGLWLRAQAWRTSARLTGNAQFWAVGALGLLTAWMLIANWRHSRRRQAAQKALMAETNFRRAMENSMLTGMRALDLEGRITYVNPAFCEMTGWSEAELVNATAPFPYWPEQDHAQLMVRLEDELKGLQITGGFQVRVKRKDRSLFDARMYVSPLIDASGKHTGWMTSVTDITEPNRIREQLASSHDRFTIVLEALDAAVSVAPLGSQELLFANKLYRQWFGQNTQGHLQLVAQAGAYTGPDRSENQAGHDVDELAGLSSEPLMGAHSGNAEIFVAELDKWIEVRSRYLNWADGRLAQMVIATDITPRRQAEALAEQQAERAQTASRLITMGEMASSVAHELNQPLTAISNYCTGMISRIRSQQIQEQDLLWALDKTAHQAQRAGQIIQRIRSFVKRSEPNRSLARVSAMVSEAIELADIELRRRNVRLTHHLAARLPDLYADPILIEQVLINLMKNAAESIDAAKRPLGQRHVELRVVPRTHQGQAVVEFTVTDTGKGLPPETVERLYEAFFSTKVEGMGIGLNLCRSIIESHAGRIDAQNIYNGPEIAGCCFSFWLPIQTSSPPDTSTEVSP